MAAESETAAILRANAADARADGVQVKLDAAIADKAAADKLHADALAVKDAELKAAADALVQTIDAMNTEKTQAVADADAQKQVQIDALKIVIEHQDLIAKELQDKITALESVLGGTAAGQALLKERAIAAAIAEKEAAERAKADAEAKIAELSKV